MRRRRLWLEDVKSKDKRELEQLVGACNENVAINYLKIWKINVDVLRKLYRIQESVAPGDAELVILTQLLVMIPQWETFG